jgi:tetratricopeptide (TPR) repeat protein
MNPESQPILQLQSLTEAALLNCGIAPAGQWVQPHQTPSIRPPTFQEKANLRASFYWINLYRPQPESSPQKNVQGYLEAVQHLIQIEAWDLVQQILSLPISNINTQSLPELESHRPGQVPRLEESGADLEGLMDSETTSVALNTSIFITTTETEQEIDTTCSPSNQTDQQTTQTFHQQLGIWGFYREQIEIYQTLLGKISPELDCLYLEDLGHAYTCVCDYEAAISCYRQLLNLANQFQNQLTEAKALGGLGRCYTFWGQYQIARQYCHQQLKLLGSIHSSSLENTHQNAENIQECIQTERGRTLTALGYLAYFRKQPREAICYCQESLAIAQLLQDTQTEWYALGGLAIAYSQLGKHSQAIAALETQSQQPHLNAYQANASLLNLATAYLYQFNFPAVIECQQQLIDRSRKSGDIRSQCYALIYIAFIYFVQNKDPQAIEPLQQSLVIAQQFRYRQLESQALAILACIYSRQQECQKAMDYAQQALAITQSQEDMIPRYVAFVHAALGFTHFAQGNIWSGLRAFIASFLILPPWSSKDGKFMLVVILKRLFKTSRP